MTLSHQYNSNGSHRIVELDIAGFLLKSGEWTDYANVATYITSGGAVYACLSDYFEGGAMLPNVIYLISRTEFKSESKRG